MLFPVERAGEYARTKARCIETSLMKNPAEKHTSAGFSDSSLPRSGSTAFTSTDSFLHFGGKNPVRGLVHQHAQDSAADDFTDAHCDHQRQKAGAAEGDPGERNGE